MRVMGALGTKNISHRKWTKVATKVWVTQSLKYSHIIECGTTQFW